METELQQQIHQIVPLLYKLQMKDALKQFPVFLEVLNQYMDSGCNELEQIKYLLNLMEQFLVNEDYILLADVLLHELLPLVEVSEEGDFADVL